MRKLMIILSALLIILGGVMTWYVVNEGERLKKNKEEKNITENNKENENSKTDLNTELDEYVTLSNGNYIDFKNGDVVLYSKDGNELLRKDFIGYNEELGYFVIDHKEDSAKLYTEDLKEKKMNLVENKVYELTSYDDAGYLLEYLDVQGILKYLDSKDIEYSESLKNANQKNMKKVLFVDGFKVSDTSTYLIENNTISHFCDYNILGNKSYTIGKYNIYIKEEAFSDNTFYRTGIIIDTKANKVWDLLGMDEDGNVFAINVENYFDGSGLGILNIKEKVVIEPKYNDVSCYFHTGEDYYVCGDGITTIADDKLISLKTGKVIIEMDSMSEIKTGLFIGYRDNRYMVFDNTGKIMKEFTINSEVYCEPEFGFISIKEDGIVELFDTNYKAVSLTDSIIDKLIELKILYKADINSNEYFNYTGTDIQGEQIMYINCDAIYALIDKKFEKLNNDLVKNNFDFCF